MFLPLEAVGAQYLGILSPQMLVSGCRWGLGNYTPASVGQVPTFPPEMAQDRAGPMNP